MKTVTSTASWAIGYRDIPSLTNGASTVIMGTVISEKTYKVNYGADFIIFTNYTIAVSNVYKGDVLENIMRKTN